MKIQVNISDELVKEVDQYAEKIGVSRSALCAMFIGQGVLGYNKKFQDQKNDVVVDDEIIDDLDDFYDL